MADRLDEIEERMAHLIRSVDDLSDMVAKQANELDQMTRQLAMLMQREAAREAEGSGGALFGDERPPHY